jgi:hypothetical protein
MGTSSSFRSPSSPRWNVFNRALDNQLPLERLRVTLFLAGEVEWRDALESPALARFAEVLSRSHGDLAVRLAEAERPAAIVGAVVGEARAACFEEGYSAALPVAERALRTILIQTTQDAVPLADADGEQAAKAWVQNRGTPADLVQRFLGEVFGQWSAHVLARDLPRLAGPGSDYSVADLGQLTTALSSEVADIAARSPGAALDEDLGSYWGKAVAAVFEQGRRLEPGR